MSDKSAEFEVGELLRAIGKVQVPEPRVLDEAREVLWSAIASEMLGTGPAGEQTAAARGPAGRKEERPRTARRRQTDAPHSGRGMSMGGTDQGS